ncbi:MAG: hypothetical protein LBL13_11950 [Bacteroidales bacterium]|jgi:hypothetical protein|nr:hypothetical protein [Bacteroidales bacterium]
MIDFFSRFDIYMKHKELNDNKISKQAGISNGLIGKARTHGGLSGRNISKILNTFSDLNANWLFTGKGKMLIKEDGYDSKNSNSNDAISIVLEKNEKLIRQNEQLETENKSLKAEIEKLKVSERKKTIDIDSKEYRESNVG